MQLQKNSAALPVRNIDQYFYSEKFAWETFCYYFNKQQSRKLSQINNPDQLSFQNFSRNAVKLIPQLLTAVEQGEYLLSPAKLGQVISKGRAREVFRFEVHDQFVLLQLARAYQQVTNPCLPENLMSFRPGYSDRMALERVSTYIKSQTDALFVLRRDIKSFGEQMRHSALIEDFTKYSTPSTGLLQLFQQVCQFRITMPGGIQAQNHRGLPTGVFLQLVAENIYLLELDTQLAALPNSFWIRYGDDIIFISPDRSSAESALKILDQEVTRKGLRFNQQKYRDLQLLKPHRLHAPAEQISEVFKPAATLNYLGMDLRWDGEIFLPRYKTRQLRNMIKQRLISALQLLQTNSSINSRIALCGKVISELLRPDSIVQDNRARSLFLDLVSREQISELDQWVALLSLKLSGKAGFKKGYLGSHPLKTLRDLGLPSFNYIRSKFYGR